MKLVGNLPEASNATAINFMEYERSRGKGGKGGKALDVMLMTGRFGLKSYSLENPRRPKLMDQLTAEQLRLTGDPPVSFTPDANGPLSTFWQNEDMDLDRERKLAFLSRDPRAYAGGTEYGPGETDPLRPDATNIAGVYVVDAKDPSDLELLSFQQLPTGHTTTCVNGCKALWTGGPAATATQRAAPLRWERGRPIIVTDLTNPRQPKAFPMQPVDLFRVNGTTTGYSHDVQVDDMGIAWVSGDGRTRGYWTQRRHFDPVQGTTRTATALDPIPYGGGLEQVVVKVTDGGFEHNAERPVGAQRSEGRPALPRRRAAPRDRGGLRAGQRGLPQPGAVHDRLARRELRRRRVAAGRHPPQDGRVMEPVPEAGLAPDRRPVRPAGQLLLGPLLRRGRQRGGLCVVRRGHAVPRHLGSRGAVPVRLLAAGQRRRLGVVHAQGLRLHGGPGPRRRRAAVDEGRALGPRRPAGGRARAPSRRQRRFLAKLAWQYRAEPGTAGLCLLQSQ